MMKRWTILLVPLLAMGSLLGQPHQGRGAGFGYASLGAATEGHGSEAFWAFGGGGEYVASSGLGLRLDVGVLTDSGLDEAVGIFTPGVLFEFKPERRTAPFVTTGYTLLFRSGTANGLHFGAGVRHWFRERFGIRFEVRDDVLFPDGAFHFISGRVSFLFR